MMHTPASRRLSAAAAGALLLGLLVGTPSAGATVEEPSPRPAPAAGRTATLQVPAGPFIRGEGVSVSGTVPGSHRYVRLQVKRGRTGGGAWTFRGAVRSDARGRWAGTFVMPRTTPGSYRLRVAPGQRGGRDASPVLIRRLVDQTADLTLDPAVAPTGGHSTLTARFAPARPGRPVSIQERVDGAWQRLALSEQSDDGTVQLTLDDLADGTRTFRALTARQPSVKAAYSPERTLSVVPPYAVRVSSTPTGKAGGGGEPSVSDDGTRIAFVSTADLVGDGVTGLHVFVHDTTTGETERVSVSDDGVPADGRSVGPAISGDGTRVGFVSSSTTLVEGVEPDPSGAVRARVYLRDLEAGTTELVDVGPDGTRGDGSSEAVSLNHDGTRIAYVTTSDNLPPPAGPATIVPRQVYVRDTEANTLVSATIGLDGEASLGDAEDPGIDADGDHVVFSSQAADLVPGDTNDRRDVFVTDLTTGETSRVSVSSIGAQGGRESWQPSLSDDGTRVAFTSTSRELVDGDSPKDMDVFLHDTTTGRTSMVSRLPSLAVKAHTDQPSISGDGRFVAFSTYDGRFVPGDEARSRDVLVRDTTDGSIRRVSLDLDGTSPDADSSSGTPDADGDVVVFTSTATSFAPDDTNGTSDVFVAAMDRYPGR